MAEKGIQETGATGKKRKTKTAVEEGNQQLRDQSLCPQENPAPHHDQHHYIGVQVKKVPKGHSIGGIIFDTSDVFLDKFREDGKIEYQKNEGG